MRQGHVVSVMAMLAGMLCAATASYAGKVNTQLDLLTNVKIGTDDTFAFASTKPPKAFMDTVEFDLKSANAVLTTAFTTGAVKNLDVSLFNDTTGTTVFACTSGCAHTDTFSGLTKGDIYSLVFSGTTMGRKGSTSNIDGTLSVAAVPEPSTWITCLAGLGLLGFYFRRRNARIGARTLSATTESMA